MPDLHRTSANPGPVAVFAALGEPTRLHLLNRLSDGSPRSITSLSADTELTRQAVTKHLRVLQNAGLVNCDRIGRESRFSLRPEPIDELRDYLDRISAQWEDALGRLKRHVED
jgi:DNA-binding transcriptional ArsR family regulator